jgi:hypothetical protein
MVDVQKIANRVLKPKLAKLGLEEVVVKEGLDHDGEESLFIDAKMRPGARIVGGEISSKIHAALSEALRRAGEPRFPYFNIRHPDRSSGASARPRSARPTS